MRQGRGHRSGRVVFPGALRETDRASQAALRGLGWRGCKVKALLAAGGARGVGCGRASAVRVRGYFFSRCKGSWRVGVRRPLPREVTSLGHRKLQHAAAPEELVEVVIVQSRRARGALTGKF
jgi:hypothetical protein